VGRIWIGARQFQGLDNNGTADISLSQGTPTWEPASGTWEIGCIPMTTADEVHTILPIPWDLDINAQVGGRVWFVHASTDASDAPVFKVTVKFLGKQAQTVELAAGADVSVSITHSGTSATNDSLEITNWTNLRWDEYIARTDILAGITLELDALGSAGADECEFIGLELAYQRNAAGLHFQTSAGFIRSNPL
jgi:hypothetical protein